MNRARTDRLAAMVVKNTPSNLVVGQTPPPRGNGAAGINSAGKMASESNQYNPTFHT